MGRPERRRKVHYGDTHLQRRWRVRSRKRDLDLVSSGLLFSIDDAFQLNRVFAFVLIAD